jgi:hypothetical protein
MSLSMYEIGDGICIRDPRTSVVYLKFDVCFDTNNKHTTQNDIPCTQLWNTKKFDHVYCWDKD